MMRHNHDAADQPDAPLGTGPVLQVRRALVIAAAVIVLAAMVVRIWAAQDELWMDEIWTLMGIGARFIPRATY